MCDSNNNQLIDDELDEEISNGDFKNVPIEYMKKFITRNPSFLSDHDAVMYYLMLDAYDQDIIKFVIDNSFEAGFVFDWCIIEHLCNIDNFDLLKCFLDRNNNDNCFACSNFLRKIRKIRPFTKCVNYVENKCQGYCKECFRSMDDHFEDCSVYLDESSDPNHPLYKPCCKFIKHSYGCPNHPNYKSCCNSTYTHKNTCPNNPNYKACCGSTEHEKNCPHISVYKCPNHSDNRYCSEDCYWTGHDMMARRGSSTLNFITAYASK